VKDSRTGVDSTGIVLIVINAYLPCDSHSNVDQYLDCLGKIVAFTDELTGPFTIVGDFNCTQILIILLHRVVKY